MRGSIQATIACLLALPVGAASGCQNSGKKDKAKAQPPGAPAVAEKVGDVGGAVTDVGAACQPDPKNRQGNCPDGLICGPTPGGYCTTFCDIDADCGPGATCADTIRGTVCTRSCTADTDCRAEHGYMCDPTWRVCAHRDIPLLASKLPQCQAKPLGRRTFGPAVQVTTAAGGSISDQEVHAAIAGDGGVHLAYIARRPLPEPNALGLASIGPDGRVATTDARLPDARANHYDPWMASSRDGRLSLVWLGYDGGIAPEKRMQIGFATSERGATWSETRSAHAAIDCPDEQPGCLDKPMMAIGPDKDDLTRDAIYVAYYGARDKSVVVKSVDGGATFGESAVLGENLYGDLRVDARGDVHMVHTADGYIEYLRSQDGGRTFADAIRVKGERASATRFSNPQVAFDSQRGRLYVAYPVGGDDLRWDITLAVSSDDGASFTYHRVNDDAPCAHHMVPSMALDKQTGRVHIMWLENRTGAGLLAYTSCDESGCAANERISDTPMAAYGLTRHTRKWLGEYNALLIDDKRRILHALWAHPSLEQRSEQAAGAGSSEPVPTARIFYARARLGDLTDD